jgi:hypothetical protein
MEKQGLASQMMRMGERLGLYRPEELKMDTPVYGSLDEWVNAHG